MTVKGYESPSLRNIFIGILAFVVLLAALCNLPNALKLVGNVFLFVPAQLGLIQRVRPAEVHTIDLTSPSPAVFEITKAGRYAIYTDDYDLLMGNVLNGTASLQVKSQASGEQIKVQPVTRGAGPFDTALAPGRPILVFDLPAPGRIEIAYFFRYATIAIVPDYVTGKEPLIVFLTIVQIAILLALVSLLYYPAYQRRRERLRRIEMAPLQRRPKE